MLQGLFLDLTAVKKYCTIREVCRLTFTCNLVSQEFINILKERNMKNPLDSIEGAIASGFVLTVILFFVVKMLV